MRNLFTCIAAATIALPMAAGAVTINFDDQGLTGPSTFGAASPSPQTVVIATSAGNVTFEGGVILENTTNLPANQTALYGTASFGSGLSNPITITFENPITNFLISVVNGVPETLGYTVSDNAGNSSSFSLASNVNSGATTIGFAASGTVVTITSDPGQAILFDFFVDNIQFNIPIVCGPDGCGPTGVPLPASFALFGMGLLGLGMAMRRRA